VTLRNPDRRIGLRSIHMLQQKGRLLSRPFHSIVCYGVTP